MATTVVRDIVCWLVFREVLFAVFAGFRGVVVPTL